ncbi:MAG: alpha/beta hydrolase [Arcicella sp.]|nr:alpha/beta hydrolase [Arcicella sp.]
MKKISFLVLIFLFSSCKNDLELIIPNSSPGLSGSVADSEFKFEEKFDISYGKDVLQKYDLYLPSTRNTRNPVIVLLHPGAWRIGDKSAINSIVRGFVNKRVNCAIVNVNYRLTSFLGVTYKQQLEDINTLLKKIKTDSYDLGISSDNFYLIGISSGGHLALLYANSSSGDRLAKGVGAVVPPVNLASPAMRNGSLGLDIQKFIGKTFAESPDEYYDNSPAFKFNFASPPTIVFFGGKDEVIPLEQSDFCRQTLIANRAKNEYNFYPNQPHEWNIWSETIDKLVIFAQKNL